MTSHWLFQSESPPRSSGNAGLLILLIFVLGFLLVPLYGQAQTLYTVTVGTDVGAPGELRAAILAANGDGTDSIIQVAVSPPSPIILNPANGPLVIQTENRTWVQGPGALVQEINGNGVVNVFEIYSSGNCISDLSIYGAVFNQIKMDGTTLPVMTNWVYGCLIGTDPTYTAGGSNLYGVSILGVNAAYNVVGTDGGSVPGMNGEVGSPPINISPGAGSDLMERNYICNNTAAGVYLGSTTTANRVAGNFIGTDVVGTLSIPNGEGVLLDSQAFGNCIGISDGNSPINFLGGGEADEWNLISGNTSNGVLLDFCAENWIAGNIIGLDVSGAAILTGPMPGNGKHGVHVTITSGMNTIGTDGDGSADAVAGAPTGGERNLLSNNTFNGVMLDASSVLNVVAGNHIGMDITGMVAFANGLNGVEVDTAPQTLIGTNSDAVSDLLEGNLISGNNQQGIFIAANEVAVCGNIIGLDITEGGTVGNNLSGIKNSGGSACFIGFNTIPFVPAAVPSLIQANVISHNGQDGIFLTGSTCSGVMMHGNYIGTDSAGTAVLGNVRNGVYAELNATLSSVGFASTISSIPPNVIHHNGAAGVQVDGAGTVGITISGNSINSNTGLGIDLTNGSNGGILPPTINTIDVSGGAADGITTGVPDGSTVELFYDDADEGLIYLDQCTVTGNVWNIPNGIFYPASGTWNATATVTDTSGNTSEFSTPVVFTEVEDWMELGF
jgi:hypothetical protein